MFVIRSIFNGFYDLVYPPNCIICKTYISSSFPKNKARFPAKELCSVCSQSITYNIPPFCPKCSRHLGQNQQYPFCRDCINTKKYFDFAWGACIYNDSFKKILHKFKYEQKTLLRHIFSELIINFIKKYNFDLNQFQYIVPIPLHPTRLRERGYNQSLMLSKEIAREFKINLLTNNLIRVKYTKSQANLCQKERWTNIKGAFRIKCQNQFNNKAILLLDDLYTTGATTSEAAKILKKAGAKTIGVLTLAIAI